MTAASPLSRLVFKTAILALAVLAVLGPACRARSSAEPGTVRLIDLLTDAGVVESPLKNTAAGERFFPVKSTVMTEAGSGEQAFGVKRRLNVAQAEQSILFAPPRSEYQIRLPSGPAGTLDFGIGIVRDANSSRQKAKTRDGESSEGVTFLLIEERSGRKSVLFERRLAPPKIRSSRTVARSRFQVPFPARDGGTTLTLVTAGEIGLFSFWDNPVIRVPRKAPLNVVLISLDTLRADHVGTYGYARPVSPAIDALAADGAVFENVFSTASWTIPAHVSMFTGLNGVRHRVYDERGRMDPRTVTLAEKMREKGFATHAITAGGFVSATFGFAKGFDEYHMEKWGFEDSTEAEKTGREAAQWIEKNTDRPFFLLLHTYQIHLPYKSPEPYRSMFLGPSPRWTFFDLGRDGGGREGIYKTFSEADRENIIGLYDAGIRYTDETLIKPVVEALRRLGLYDRTLIIVTADHGEEFFEHGGWNHTHGVYNEAIRVPLVLKMPDSKYKGRRIAPFVRLIDLMPTVLDLFGIPTEELKLDGSSLLPLLKGKEKADRPFLAEHADNVNENQVPQRLALSAGRLKAIINHPFTEKNLAFFSDTPPDFPPIELYDLAADPLEKVNLADRPSEAGRALIAKAREHDRLVPKRGKGKLKVDKALEEQLRSLGYIK